MFLILIIIIIFSTNSFCQTHGGVPQDQGFIDVFDVQEEYISHSTWTYTEVIQDIFDSIKNNMDFLGRGGIVYFPPGIYEINNTLMIPPRTYVFGMSGGFNLSGDSEWPPEDKVNHQPVILRWTSDECKNMIEPYPYGEIQRNNTTLESVIIQGLTLDGCDKARNGIYLPPIIEPGHRKRSGLIVREVIIYRMKECGFLSKNNQSEFFLEKVCAMYNGKWGFRFEKGSDINLTSVWSGGNEKDGFYFYHIDNVRSFNCDAWGNKCNGAYIKGSGGLSFHKFQSNNNQKNGIAILNSFECHFIGSIFMSNSQMGINKHSEIYITDNSKTIKFIGCRIGNYRNNPDYDKAKYGILDSSSKVYANIIIGCTFHEGEFQTATFNDAVLENYIIEGCTGGSYGTWKYTHPYKFIETSVSPYHLKNYHSTLYIDTTDEGKQLKLPEHKSPPNSESENIPIGKEYIIIKKLADEKKILVTPYDGDTINGSDSLYYFEDTEANASIRIIKVSNHNWVIIK